ncbi:hypothetical protein [Stieleria maiorica]|nr:hypothetical protein [Stieleria maiorica]
MANEIRVLEDQLYDADYQNRVLRDELERSRLRDAADDPNDPPQRQNQRRPAHGPPTPVEPDDYEILELDPPAAADRPAPKSPTPAVIPTPADEPGMGLPLPPASDDQPADPAPEPEPTPDPATPQSPQPLVDPPTEGLGMPREAIETPAPAESEGPFSELPPPTELIPPGEGELMDDQIIPGPPLPPDEDPESPPGKVTPPSDAKKMGFEPPEAAPLAIPDRLELHDGLSGGHQFDKDAEIDGLLLIVTVVDQDGRALSLENFDVDAELTVVVLDPEDDSEDASLGRWEFDPDQVRDMVRRTPIDGIHVPIEWQDRIPDGHDVMVHVRMAAAEEEMRCQGRVRLEQSVASANWLPRG